MGMDNDNKPVINYRIDNAKRTIEWKVQFKSNAPLRNFAKIKAWLNLIKHRYHAIN